MAGKYACLEGSWRGQTLRSACASEGAFASTSNSRQAHTGFCRLVGERRGAWDLRSVHARAVGSLPLPCCLSFSWTLARSIRLLTHYATQRLGRRTLTWPSFS